MHHNSGIGALYGDCVFLLGILIFRIVFICGIMCEGIVGFLGVILIFNDEKVQHYSVVRVCYDLFTVLFYGVIFNLAA